MQVYSEDPPDTKKTSLSPLASFVSVGLSAIARQQVASLLEKEKKNYVTMPSTTFL